jgi:hypothetical protein
MLMYKARYSWEYNVESVEVDRVTEKSVFINAENRVMRRESEGLKFCDTFTEAKEAVLSAIRWEIESVEKRLQSLKQSLERIEAMTPETTKPTYRTY